MTPRKSMASIALSKSNHLLFESIRVKNLAISMIEVKTLLLKLYEPEWTWIP